MSGFPYEFVFGEHGYGCNYYSIAQKEGRHVLTRDALDLNQQGDAAGLHHALRHALLIIRCCLQSRADATGW
jgi:hypothetical protein